MHVANRGQYLMSQKYGLIILYLLKVYPRQLIYQPLKMMEQDNYKALVNKKSTPRIDNQI